MPFASIYNDFTNSIFVPIQSLITESFTNSKLWLSVVTVTVTFLVLANRHCRRKIVALVKTRRKQDKICS